MRKVHFVSLALINLIILSACSPFESHVLTNKEAINLVDSMMKLLNDPSYVEPSKYSLSYRKTTPTDKGDSNTLNNKKYDVDELYYYSDIIETNSNDGQLSITRHQTWCWVDEEELTLFIAKDDDGNKKYAKSVFENIDTIKEQYRQITDVTNEGAKSLTLNFLETVKKCAATQEQDKNNYYSFDANQVGNLLFNYDLREYDKDDNLIAQDYGYQQYRENLIYNYYNEHLLENGHVSTEEYKIRINTFENDIPNLDDFQLAA